MVQKQLHRYITGSDIKDGNLTIEQFQVQPAEQKEGVLCLRSEDTEIILSEGQDLITVKMDLIVLINELVSLFHRFNCWEQKLQSVLSDSLHLQAVLNTFEEVCPYPVIFMELDGSILAISQNYPEDAVNEDWYYMKTSLQVPMGDNRSQYNEIKENTFVDETPRIFKNNSGENYIAMYFQKKQTRFMGMIIMEYGAPFTPDIFQLCTFLSETILKHDRNMPPNEMYFRTKSSILYDLLENNPVSAIDLDRFYENQSFIFPWYLLVADKNTHISEDVISFAIEALRKNVKIKTAVVNYKGQLTILVQQLKIALLLKELNHLMNLSYYKVGISMPFQSLQNLHLRYEEAVFAMKADQATGIRFCKDYALNYMIHSIRKTPLAIDMIHPALAILHEADIRKNSQLYETLWIYLNNDRSILKTAEKMYLHRNSMLYRIKKIQELTDIDLEDPNECEYLRLSYMIEKDSPGLS